MEQGIPVSRSRCMPIRALRVIGGFMALLCLIGCGEERRSVFEAYEQAMVSPEGFDAWVATKGEDFDKDFDKCLPKAREELLEMAAEAADICDVHIDPVWYQRCMNEIEEAKVLSMLNVIDAVINGGASFGSTDVGGALIAVKADFEAMYGAGSWEELVRPTIPMFEDYLVCKHTKYWFDW